MRIVSLLPAATEIVGCLGRLPQLVGVSHECDYPADVHELPRVTRCPIQDQGLSSAEVDRWVRETLAANGTLYSIDEELLRDLQPDVILTQRLCDVCAVGYGSVSALAASLPKPPQVVNLEPTCLADIFQNIRDVASVLDATPMADQVIADFGQRIENVKTRVTKLRRPRCLLLEWIDPLFCSGHWGPELVALAGAVEVVGESGKLSRKISWQRMIDVQPEVIVIACCGYDAAKTMAELPVLTGHPGWSSLPAVQDHRVFVADGNAYFNRPGPRIVDSLELLAELLHPEFAAEDTQTTRKGIRI